MIFVLTSSWLQRKQCMNSKDKLTWTLTLITCTLSMLLIQVRSDTGNCRFDNEFCSCKVGAEKQGVCWDAHRTISGMCTKRFCKAGWTCSCGGRTHLCNMRTTTIHKLIDPAIGSVTDHARCTTGTSPPQAGGPSLILGGLRIHMSRKGMLKNSCTNFAWWHNGELLGTHISVPAGEKMNVNEEVEKRSVHDLLELKPGDIIAYRWRNASYYCNTGLIEFDVNGTSISSQHPNISAVYARDYSTDWFLPSTKLTAANTGLDESEPDLTKFIPVRTKMLTSGAPIVPGEDNWQPIDNNSPDHVEGDFYFRIQLPMAL